MEREFGRERAREEDNMRQRENVKEGRLVRGLEKEREGI